MNSAGEFGQEQRMQEEQKRQQYTEMKQSLLHAALDQAALGRYNTIILTRPEFAQKIEPFLLRAAQTGQKITDESLRGLLAEFSSKMQAQTSTKVNFRRRRIDSDDSDDDL